MKQNDAIKNKLGRYIDAGFPILYIRTFDEREADMYIKSAAGGSKIIEWNGAKGLVNFETKSPLMANQTLESALKLQTKGEDFDGKLLVIKDADELLNDEQSMVDTGVVALLKELARKIYSDIDATVIIVSSALHIPQALEKMITVIELDFPEADVIREIIIEFTKENKIKDVNKTLLDKMTDALKGLSEYEIESLLSLARSSYRELTDKTLDLINEQKQQMVRKAGLLEIIPPEESLENIGGLENLKEWLKEKAKIFKNLQAAQKFGVPTPKGVLITGIAGCGKSLCAKAAGNLFEAPLLRLDMGRLMGKYVGESEEKMRKALKLAEAMSPCILWIDELEKAFAGTGDDNGSEVTTRLFGEILTWMQDKTCPAFVVATANKINNLPPELLRKGRFDEIFYVGLPNDSERKRIFEIHINKRRKQDLAKIDINALVAKTKDYCGADIEGVIGESIGKVFVNERTALTTEDILKCIENTHPLSETMADEIKEMKEAYDKRKLKEASRN